MEEEIRQSRQNGVLGCGNPLCSQTAPSSLSWVNLEAWEAGGRKAEMFVFRHVKLCAVEGPSAWFNWPDF